MKRLLAVSVAAAGAAGAVIWWRRRSTASSQPPVQLGLSDGSTLTLAAGEPLVAQLAAEADDVRRAFAAGA